MRDESIIPPGGFCYRVRRLAPGEVLSTELHRFGKNLREYAWRGPYKEVLCLYWQQTDYGMVRCDFLEIEGLDDLDVDARAKALAHLGSEEALFAVNRASCLLSDQVKICGIKEDEDEDWDCVVADE